MANCKDYKNPSVSDYELNLDDLHDRLLKAVSFHPSAAKYPYSVLPALGSAGDLIRNIFSILRRAIAAEEYVERMEKENAKLRETIRLAERLATAAEVLDLAQKDGREAVFTNSKFVGDLFDELSQAEKGHKPLNSAHEAYAVILEELDEFKGEVWKRRENRDPAKLYKDLLQTAAMCWRAVRDLGLEPAKVKPQTHAEPQAMGSILTGYGKPAPQVDRGGRTTGKVDESLRSLDAWEAVDRAG